jgi:hypothetical protein
MADPKDNENVAPGWKERWKQKADAAIVAAGTVVQEGADWAAEGVDDLVPDHIEEEWLGDKEAIKKAYEKHVEPVIDAGVEVAVGAAKKAVENFDKDPDGDMLEAAKKSRVNEQCYLTYHMKSLAELHQLTMEPSPRSSAAFDPDRFPHFGYEKTHLLNGRPAEVFPKLHLREDAHRLLDATTADLASLVPMIKLYKTVNTDTSAYEIPFKFYNHTVTETDHGRSAVGIKSFDWKYNSGNFDTVQKDISAQLVLHFQGMDELIRVRSANVKDTASGNMISANYSYLDLIVNPARSTQSTSLSNDQQQPGSDNPCDYTGSEYNAADYEIKARVGWAPEGAPGSLQTAVENASTDIFLSLTDHSFNINQDGTFDLTIGYKSRIEGIAESPKSNVLFCDKNILEMESFKALIDNENMLDQLNKEKCANNKSEKEKLQKASVNIQDALRNETYKSIITNLMKPEKYMQHFQSTTSDDEVPQRLIYSALVNPQELVSLADTKGKFEDQPDLDFENVTSTELIFKGGENGPWSDISVETADGKIDYSPSNPEEKLINFFFLGDLLDMLMITVFDTEKYDGLSEDIRKKYSFNTTEVENLKLLLGPFEFRDPRTNKVELINMANIPVSVDAFTDFFHRKVIKQHLSVYEFRTFLNDLVSDLIQTALGKECFDIGDTERHNSQIRTGYIEAPLREGVTDYVVATAMDQNGHDPSGASRGNPSTAKVDMNLINHRNTLFHGFGTNYNVAEYGHYIVAWSHNGAGLRYPGTPGYDLESGKTPQTQDLDRGIHHLFIGRDKGLVATVSFNKTDSPYLRQARLENAGSFDPLLQLSDVYEASIELLGNTLFLPGDRIYLNPFGLSWGENFGVPHQRGSISNIMGLGGYHIVTSVSNYIESGKYSTSLQARFESPGDGCKVVSTEESKTKPCPEEDPS